MNLQLFYKKEKNTEFSVSFGTYYEYKKTSGLSPKV